MTTTTTIELDRDEHTRIVVALKANARAAEERNASRYGPQTFAMDDEHWAFCGWCWAADVRASVESRALIAKLDARYRQRTRAAHLLRLRRAARVRRLTTCSTIAGHGGDGRGHRRGPWTRRS